MEDEVLVILVVGNPFREGNGDEQPRPLKHIRMAGRPEVGDNIAVTVNHEDPEVDDTREVLFVIEDILINKMEGRERSIDLPNPDNPEIYECYGRAGEMNPKKEDPNFKDDDVEEVNQDATVINFPNRN